MACWHLFFRRMVQRKVGVTEEEFIKSSLDKFLSKHILRIEGYDPLAYDSLNNLVIRRSQRFLDPVFCDLGNGL